LVSVATEGAFVGRRRELAALERVLESARNGRGSVTLITGPAGAGKTSLAERLEETASSAGFQIARGTTRSGPEPPYDVFAQALRTLELDHLLNPAPRPRVLGLFAYSEGGRLLGSAQRKELVEETGLFASMTSALESFFREALAPGAAPGEEMLTRIAVGERTLCVMRRGNLSIAALLEGRENELLLSALRELVSGVDPRFLGATPPDGDASQEESLSAGLESVLDSGRFDGIDPSEEPGGLRFDILESVAHGLHRLANRRPILLILDDIHLCGSPSLGLLQHLGWNLESSRVAVVALCRLDGDPSSAGNDALASLLRQEWASPIRLESMTDEDSLALAKRLMGMHGLPDAVLAKLAAKAGGNPLFIRELVRVVRSQARFGPDGEPDPERSLKLVDRLQLPQKVRGVILERIRNLSKVERALLEAASVLGTTWSPVILAQITEQAELRVLQHLAEISRTHGLVREEADAWRFDHPLVQELLFEEIPRSLRRAYHRRAAEALGAAGSPPDQVGWHFSRADDPRAVEPLRTAADLALAQGSPDQAAEYLETARDLAEKDERGAIDLRRAELLELAGRYEGTLKALGTAEAERLPLARAVAVRAAALKSLGRTEEALAAVSEAVRILPEAESRELRVLRADILDRQGRYQDAERAVREALAGFGAEEDLLRARALLVLGVVLTHVSRLDEAVAALQEAQSTAERGGSLRWTAAALNNLANAQLNQGNLSAGIENYRKCLRTFQALGNRRGTAAALANLGSACLVAGDFEGAVEWCRRSAELMQSIGQQLDIPIVLGNLISSLLEVGDVPGALSHVPRAIELARKTGDQGTLSWALVCAARAYYRDERWAESRSAAEEAGSIATRIGMPHETILSRRALGLVAMAEGRVDDAEACFREALAGAIRIGAPLDEAETELDWGIAWADAGEPDEARGHLERARELFWSRLLPKRSGQARAMLDSLGARSEVTPGTKP
jgi:tetratricopeptide (TPR) repeat protein